MPFDATHPNEPSGAERRRAPRADAPLADIEALIVIDGPGGRQRYRGIVKDVSANGVAIWTERSLLKGDHVLISLGHDIDHPVVDTEPALVVRADLDEDDCVVARCAFAQSQARNVRLRALIDGH